MTCGAHQQVVKRRYTFRFGPYLRVRTTGRHLHFFRGLRFAATTEKSYGSPTTACCLVRLGLEYPSDGLNQHLWAERLGQVRIYLGNLQSNRPVNRAALGRENDKGDMLERIVNFTC